MPDVEKKRDDDESKAAPEKKGMSPLILIIVGLIGLVIAGTVAFIIVHKVLTAPAKDAAPKEEDKAAGKEVYFGKLFSFDEPIIVNLAGTKGQRYLKVSIKFEVTDDAVVEELTTRKPMILDLLISILSSKSIEDVSDTIGRNRLRREVIDKGNAEIVSGKIINVYFTEFVIQ